MTTPLLHPWLGTPEAVMAARRAVTIPDYKMPSTARIIGADELFSEALAILTECACPPREREHRACSECGGALDNVRAGAKFCSAPCRNRHGVRRHRAGEAAPPAQPQGHVGSMWTWPEDEMSSYATRQVGMVLCNYLRTRSGRSEVANSERIENTDIPVGTSEPEAREVIEDFLVANGVEFDGTESFEELVEAAQWIQKKVA